MQTTGKNVAIFASALIVMLASGCSLPQSQVDATSPVGSSTQQQNDPAAKRFQESPLHGRTAVESALELSEKYARLSDQAAKLREENQNLTAENKQLKQQLVSLEAKLKQTQRELNEANELLIEMLTELNNWKTNILGFRNEMREAAKAQLEALLKVLEILGGEAQPESGRQQNAAPPNMPTDKPVESDQNENPSLGQSNE